MPRNSYSTWLTKINYPKTGVGDINDLRFAPVVGDNGKWLGVVNNGWFYYDGLEQYHYVDIGQFLFNANPGSGVVVETTSFRPAWGPVLLDGASQQYLELHNIWLPAMSLSWSSSGSLYYSTLPSGTILTGVRDLTVIEMGAVNGPRDLISSKFYWYDFDHNLLYIKPKDPNNITVFADLLSTTPSLQVRELVVLEEDGVRASYTPIESLTISRNDQVTSVAGVVTGYVQPGFTNTYINDWIVLEYLVQYSYCVIDHQTIHYYSTSASSDVITVSYEKSLPEILPTVEIHNSYEGKLNLNPLYEDAHRSGYLFHSDTSDLFTTFWIPSKIEIELDKNEVCPDLLEPFKLRIAVFDQAGLPIPWYPLTITGVDINNVINIHPNVEAIADAVTDGKGECHILFTLGQDLTSPFTITAAAGNISGSTIGRIIPISSIFSSTRYTDGMVAVSVLSERTRSKKFRTLVGHNLLDGIPVGTGNDLITIKSKLASEMEIPDGAIFKISNNEISLGTNQHIGNIGAFTEIGYLPQPGDQLVARRLSAQTEIYKGPQ